jgi:hypothetical protein
MYPGQSIPHFAVTERRSWHDEDDYKILLARSKIIRSAAWSWKWSQIPKETNGKGKESCRARGNHKLLVRRTNDEWTDQAKAEATSNANGSNAKLASKANQTSKEKGAGKNSNGRKANADKDNAGKEFNTAALPPEMPNQEPLPNPDAPGWKEWMFRGFDHRATVPDHENAEEMFTYLLIVHPENICCKQFKTCDVKITTPCLDFVRSDENRIPLGKKLPLIDRQAISFLCDENPIVKEYNHIEN